MKIHISSFYDLYEAPDLDLPPDPDVDVERIKKLVLSRIRREQRHRFRRLASLVVAATLALTLVGCGGYAAWKQYNSMGAKDIDFGDQEQEPGMMDWSEDNQGMLFTFENAVAGNLVGFTCGFEPETGTGYVDDFNLYLADRMRGMGYSQDEIRSCGLSEDQLKEVCVKKSQDRGNGAAYLVEVIQSADVATRTFSLQGRVTIEKNEIWNEYEATWLTLDTNYYTNKQDITDNESYHQLFLYHSEKHYLIIIAVNTRYYEMQDLITIADQIEIYESNIVRTESNAYPDQTYSLLPVFM